MRKPACARVLSWQDSNSRPDILELANCFEIQDHRSAIRISLNAADRPRAVVMLQLGRAKFVPHYIRGTLASSDDVFEDVRAQGRSQILLMDIDCRQLA